MNRPSDTLAAALAPVAAEARRLARRRLRTAVTVTVAPEPGVATTPLSAVGVVMTAVPALTPKAPT